MAYACAGDYARPYPFLCQCPSKMGTDESGTACQTGNIQEIERKILHPKGHTHPLQRHSIRERCSGFLGDRLLLWNCWPCLSGPGSTLYSGADEATKEGLEAL